MQSWSLEKERKLWALHYMRNKPNKAKTRYGRVMYGMVFRCGNGEGLRSENRPVLVVEPPNFCH